MGGAEHSLLTLLRKIPKQDYTPVIVCNQEGELTALAQKYEIQYIIRRYPSLFSRNPFLLILRIFQIPVSILRIVLLVRKTGPALLHSNSRMMHLLVSIAGRICGVPTICHIRWIPSTGIEAGIQRHLFELVRPYLICISSSVVHLSGLAGYSRKTVIPNGVLVEECSSEAVKAIRNHYRIPDDLPLFVVLGRLEPWKGQIYALKAFREYLRMGKPGALLIVGEDLFGGGGEYRRELAEFITNEIDESARMTGHVTNSLDYILAADAVLHTSITPEPFGRVVIEGMVLGKPVIASNCGGPTEIINDGVDGFLRNPRDSAAIAVLLSELVEDPDLYNRISTNARERAESEYSATTHSRKVLNFYDSVLKK